MTAGRRLLDALPPGSSGAAEARRFAMAATRELGFPELADDVALVVSELVTNAILHGGGCTGVQVEGMARGVRVCVSDGNRALPLLGHPSESSMTGRGLRLVRRLASDWGVEGDNAAGKTVWADVTGTANAQLGGADLLGDWGDDLGELEPRFPVELGEVPTDLLLAAKAHVDNLVREFELMKAGAASGTTPALPSHLGSLLRVITDRFAEARMGVKEQALRAVQRREPRTRLALELPASAADAGGDYLRALDELDDYCRANRLFTLETEPEHRVFRRWYVGEIVRQLRAAAAGEPVTVAQTFERRVLDELSSVARTHRVADRAARLATLAAALAVSATPEAVAAAALGEGLEALEADAGGLLLSQKHERVLGLPGAVGYDDRTLERLRSEPRDADLPAAQALRTGEPVWLETREERDARFPETAMLEPDMEALCAVPLALGMRCLGALRFSFRRPRVFDDEERRFVLALADQTAQALERAQLQQDRIDVSRRLQRSLLPPALPEIPGLELAAIYHPFGDGMEVGGDFYDVWQLDEARWAIAVGDASGTGPEAAGLTALVRHSLRALSLSEHHPDRLLRQLNTLLVSGLPDDERFCTALVGVVTVGDTTVLRLASAGHPPPVIRGRDGSVRHIAMSGTLLGAVTPAAIDELDLVLTSGDTVVFLTDGVLESRDRSRRFFEEEGVDRVLRSAPASAAAVATALEQAVLAHTGGAPEDDIAIVVVRAA